MFKVKVILMGPSNGGKTTIANFLADATESTGGEYHPTEGVRILQFESANLNVSNRSVKAEVELWDCSGDHRRFESCWPAFSHEAQGVILVYDPNEQGHPRELERLYSYFVEQAGLSPGNCLVLSNPRAAKKSSALLSGTFSRVHQTLVNIDEKSNKLRSDFSTFLERVISQLRDTHEQEELNIMSSIHSHLDSKH